MFFFCSLCFLLGLAYSLDNTTPLRHLLSPGSRIDGYAPRWSEYGAPSPASVVHPATVSDVQITIQWADRHNIPFLVYNGGNGWPTDFKLDPSGFYLALDLLRSVVFNHDKTVATIGAGALTADVVEAGSEAGSLVATATCDCVAFLGALLGGGAGHLTGQYGLLVDTVLSMDVVLSDGSLRTVTESSDPDLWWALRGAGPNFGVVVEVSVDAHPDAPLTGWQGSLVFSPEQLASVLAALAALTLPPPSALGLLYAMHNGSPAVVVDLFFHGSAAEARESFASLLTIGPVSDSTSTKPWKEWNAPSAAPCRKGGRKPTWGAGMSRFDPVVFGHVFDVWHEAVQHPAAVNSSMLLNWFPMEKARSMDLNSSAVPFRHHVDLFPTLTVAYEDPAFDEVAVEYGTRARWLWQAGDGLEERMTYINNAFGDEPLETVYGHGLGRLRSLKTRYDANCRLNQWFPLLP